MDETCPNCDSEEMGLAEDAGWDSTSKHCFLCGYDEDDPPNLEDRSHGDGELALLEDDNA